MIKSIMSGQTGKSGKPSMSKPAMLKPAIMGAAALALVFTLAPVNDAEARYGRKGALIGGLAAGALLGGALLAAPRPAYGAPVYGAPVEVYEGPSCYFVRERVWDDYRERWVRVRRRVCE